MRSTYIRIILRMRAYYMYGTTAKFKSANIFISAAQDQTAKFKDCQYFRLYGMYYHLYCTHLSSLGMSTPPLAGGAATLDLITGPKLFSINLRASQAQQTYLAERERDRTWFFSWHTVQVSHKETYGVYLLFSKNFNSGKTNIAMSSVQRVLCCQMKCWTTTVRVYKRWVYVHLPLQMQNI